MSDEWEEKFSLEKNKPYWKNKTTGKSTWNNPLPSGASAAAPAVASPVTSPTPNDEWEEKFSKEKNKPYWKNKVTGKSTWSDPHKDTGSAAAPSTPAASTAAPAAVGDEWEEKFSKEKNKPYWKNKTTGKSTWTNPHTEAASAPAAATPTPAAASAADDEWEEKFSKEKNKPYWKNKVTGKSSWNPPVAKPAAATTAAPATAVAAATPANDEWEEKFSKEKNKPYWKNKNTGKSTWNNPHTAPAGGVPPPPPPPSSAAGVKPPQPPPPPPAAAAAATAVSEWEELFNKKKNKPYWKHKTSGEMTWNDPSKSAAASSSAVTAAAPTAAAPAEVVSYDAANAVVRGVAWLVESAGAAASVTRCLLELKGLTKDTALHLFTVKTTAFVDKNDKPSPQVHSVLRLSEVKGLVCNEVLGELKFVKAATSADESPVSLAVHFCNDQVAQQWFTLVQQRVGSSTDISAVDKTHSSSSTSHKVSEEVRALISKYQCAKGGTAGQSSQLLAVESQWLLASSVFTSPLPKTVSAEEAAVVAKCKSELTKLSETASAPSAPSSVEGEVLPSSGLIVVKVLRDGNKSSTAAGAAGWVSCWVKIDFSAKNIAFHDHGPGTAASFAAHCSEATLSTSDLSDISATRELELRINDCKISAGGKDCLASLAVLFQSTAEFWKWSRVFSQVCKHFVGFNSGAPVNIPERLSHMLHDGRPFASPIRAVAPSLASQSLDVSLSLIAAFAERNMVKSAIRHVQITGLNLKTARFAQVNQRVVVLMKGNNDEFTEGSVLLSINGLSAFTVPPATMLKFISDFPRQTVADIMLWRFPRTEFHADMVGIETSFDGAAAASSNASGVQANIQSMAGDPLALDKLQSMFGVSVSAGAASAAAGTGSGSGGNASGAPGNKLEEVILRKRQSILSVAAVSSTGAAAAATEPDIAAIREQQAEQAKAAALKVTKNRLMPLNDFHRSPSHEIKWSRSRIMIASGNITILRSDSDSGGAGDVLIRLQIVNCQVSLLNTKSATSAAGADSSVPSEVYLELKDEKSHAIIRCPTLKILLCLTETILTAMKLVGSYSADLNVLYDQAEKWRRTNRVRSQQQQSVAGGAVTDKSGVHRSSLLLQSIVAATAGDLSDVDNSLDQHSGSGNTLVDPDGFEPDSSVLAAAEALEAMLSELKLPLSFPTVQNVEQQVKELYQMNLVNHRLWSKYLTMKFNASLPPDHSTAPSASGKNATVSFSDGPVDESLQNNEDKIAALTSADSMADTPPIAATAPTPKSRRLSRLSMSVDINAAAVIAKSANPTPSGSISAASASTAQMKPLLQPQTITGLLSSEDRKHLAVVLRRLSSSPDDVIVIAKRVSHHITDLEKFSEIIVNRLYNHISADPAALESLIFKAACLDKKIVKADLSEMFSKNDSGGTSRGALSSSGVDNESCFLGLLLREISHRVDVMAYLTHVCQAVTVDSLTVECTVKDLTSTIVEPLCRYLQSLLMAGHIPDALMYALCALTKAAAFDCSITAMEMLSSCLLPHLSNYIVSKNKYNRDVRAKGGLSNEHVSIIIDRLKDLLKTTLDKEIGDLLKLCFADTPSTGAAQASTVAANASPVARLAGLNSVTGKAAALCGVVCLRPSEVIFLLESLDLNSITSSTLSASSKELSDAISYLQTSSLLSRLTSAASNFHTSSRFGSSVNVMQSMDRELSLLLQVDHQPSYSILEADEAGSSGGSGSGSVFFSGDDHGDLLGPLISSDVDSQEVNDLANVQWLISAARTALRSIYEQHDLSRSQTVAKELTELKEKLQSKGEMIANSLSDLRKIDLCKDLGANLKAQIHLLLDQCKNAKYSSSSNNGGGASGNNGSMSSLQMLLTSSGSISDSPSLSFNNTPSDDEYNVALSKIVMLQLRLAADLCRKGGPQTASAAPTTAAPTAAPQSTGVSSGRNVSSPGSTTTATATGSGGGGGARSTRVQSTSALRDEHLTAKAAVMSPNKHQSTSVLNLGQNSSAVAAARKAKVGVNPLWNVMHSTFVVTSPKRSPVK